MKSRMTVPGALAVLALVLYFLAGGDPARVIDALAVQADCVVESITDGDTLRCRGGRRVRLLLIDTPELAQGPYGKLARQHLLELAPPGTTLRMEFDVQTEDRYGRTLAYLYRQDGLFLNEAMARAGYAEVLVYPPNVKHVERIRAAKEAAQRARAGLWETSAFECTPRDFRADRC